MYIVVWRVTSDPTDGCEPLEFNAGVLPTLCKTKKEAMNLIKKDIKKYIIEDLPEAWDITKAEAKKDIKVKINKESADVNYNYREFLDYSIEEVK